MSSISKMQIRGIRSFSPDVDETIEFYSPLTMIVGANGCGKTTVIESLKYACTGALPPNVRSGQSFINDPSMTDASAVKAHIKLRFQNRADQVCVAVRSMQVTKKKGKLEFKALEGVLRTTNAQGEKASIGMKCADIDRIIPENLGISSAIIENVIFVHQEDSNWPMQEGMVLKKKFDDVFESTRYTKALEALTKAKKEVQSKAKDLKAELMELGAQLDAANESKHELQTAEENHASSVADVEDIEEQLEAKDAQILECQQILSAAREQAQLLNELKQQLQQNEFRLREKEHSIETLLEEKSTEELQQIIENFTSEMQKKIIEVEDLEQSLHRWEGEIADLRNDEQQLIQQKGKAELLQSKMQSIKERQLLLGVELQGKHNLSVQLGETTADYSDAIIRAFAACLKRELHRVEELGQLSISEAQAELRRVEQEHDGVREKMQGLEVEIRYKSEAVITLQQEFNGKRVELTRLAQSQSEIAACEGDFEVAQRNYDEFMSTYEAKSNQLKAQIKDASDEIRSVQDQISAENELLQELSLRRSEIAASDAALKQANGEVVQITTELSSCFSESFDVLSDELIPTDVTQLEMLIASLQLKATDSELAAKNFTEELVLKRNSLAAKEALVNQNSIQLQQHKQTVAGMSDKIAAVSECIMELSQTLEDKLFLADSDKENKQLDVSAGIGQVIRVAQEMAEYSTGMEAIAGANRAIAKKFKKFRAERPHVCPCCEQGMEASVESTYNRNVEAYFDYQREKLGDYSHRNEISNRCLKVLRRAQDLQSELGPHENLRQEVARLQNELQVLREEIAQLRPQVENGEITQGTLNATATQYSRTLRTLHSIHARWQAATGRLNDAHEKKKRLSQSMMTTQGRSDTRTLDEVELSQRSLSERKDNIQAQKDRLIAEESVLGRNLFSLRTMMSEAESNLERARGKGIKHKELEVDLGKLQSSLKEANEEKTKLAHERESLSQLLSERQLQVNLERMKVQQLKDSEEKKLLSIRSDFDGFTTLIDSLSEVERDYEATNTHNAIQRLADVKGALLSKEEDIKNNRPYLEQIKTEISAQDRTKKNVQNNVELRKLRFDIEGIKEEIKEHEGQLQQHQLSSEDVLKAERREQRLNQERQRLLSDKDQLRGKLEIYDTQIIELTNKLNNQTYKGIEERHRRKNIEFETTTLAVGDLESYHSALDKALQNFHTLKIREINKIIRELWQLIYKGEDIDSIEIESGIDEQTASRSTRSYNYRVVMRKGDSPLDMRGRCSAGQKVLAAIVIRLALAETFCLNCGMLALDEPTTNLDEANKVGLAHALAKIIMSRSVQHNFQLICITHDEDFVKLMGRELSASTGFNMPDYYFRVYRQEDENNAGKYFSHIEREPWENIP